MTTEPIRTETASCDVSDLPWPARTGISGPRLAVIVTPKSASWSKYLLLDTLDHGQTQCAAGHWPKLEISYNFVPGDAVKEGSLIGAGGRGDVGTVSTEPDIGPDDENDSPGRPKAWAFLSIMRRCSCSCQVGVRIKQEKNRVR